MKDKIILVDVDGVLLDWIHSFELWMASHGFEYNGSDNFSINDRYHNLPMHGDKFVRMFNESAWIRKLSPQKDAIKYVKKLHEEHGFVFHAITSLSNDEYSQTLRTKNLIETFGKTVFTKFTYLDYGQTKEEPLEFYKDSGCIWVEDHPNNALLGYNLGLETFLFHQPHNAEFRHTDITRVGNWKAIYDSITHWER